MVLQCIQFMYRKQFVEVPVLLVSQYLMTYLEVTEPEVGSLALFPHSLQSARNIHSVLWPVSLVKWTFVD